MSKLITKATINGTVGAPASKSTVQRALAAAAMCKGLSSIHEFSDCDDISAAMQIIKSLGAQTSVNGRTLTVTSPGVHSIERLTIMCGESGLSSRLFSPIAMLYSTNVTVTGEGSLMQRPFGILIKDTLEQAGISYTDNDGKLPLLLEGVFNKGNITVDGSGGSQFLSGLLMAFPLLPFNSKITVTNLKSKPYIDLTIEMAKAFGVNIENKNYEVFEIKGNQTYISANVKAEGDWSGASCLLVAGAIAGSINVSNLNLSSKQADKAIIDALNSAGAKVITNENAVQVSKNELRAFNFDASHCPDLFPALVVLAAACEGTSVIKGVSRLATKESNRALTLQSEFAKLGVKIDLTDDIMHISGGTITGNEVYSHNDHRIAMALATAGIIANGDVKISTPNCVNKSYPAFWSDLNSLMKKQ